MRTSNTTNWRGLCGSTTDCNSFAADEYIGTGSIKSQKDGSIYRVTGMISFGSIKVGDASGSTKDKGKTLKPGEIGVDDYIKEVRKNNKIVDNADAIIGNIEAELKNIAGTINRTITLIESDQKIQYCINGRDLSQINGKGRSAKNTTEGRFPNLLNQYRTVIAMSALRKAQDNYNKKVTEAIAEATQNASADVAQYMCNQIAVSRTTGSSNNKISEDRPLPPPYAISYEVGTGLKTKDLVAGGAGAIKYDSAGWSNGGYLGGGSTDSMGYVLKDVTSTFERATRNCHVCTLVTTESCKTSGSSSWFHNSRNKKCDTKTEEPFCENIKM